MGVPVVASTKVLFTVSAGVGLNLEVDQVLVAFNIQHRLVADVTCFGDKNCYVFVHTEHHP